MKKILIFVLIVLLLILTYFSLTKGMKVLNIKSLDNIKTASLELESKVDEANELSNKTYPSKIEELENIIEELKNSKQEYESMSLSYTEENSLGTLQVKTYKIHYLWTILGNYRKDRKIQSLNLDLKNSDSEPIENEQIYDLEFTLIGRYTDITDFIYDIENDEELNFEISNFVISYHIDTNNENNNNQITNESTNNSNNDNSNNNNNSEQNTKEEDGILIQAKFTVEDIGITLD